MVKQVDGRMVVSVVKPVVQTKEKVVFWKASRRGNICRGDEKVVGGDQRH